MNVHTHGKNPPSRPAGQSDDRTLCAHGPCRCEVLSPRQGYCSEYCRHAATSGPPREEPVCECGHAACRD
ncbi:MAG: hypothetical protein J0H15_10290 [Xanthomonadales bacterium]|nr:hypothetical protein [Xanthomonadales bacterium]